MKKLLFGLAVSALALVLVACTANKKETTLDNDALRFKKEYEDLNGATREKDGKTIREVNIPEDNPIIYSNCTEILEMMNDKQSFAVYFGFTDCPWCRSCVETMIASAKDAGITTLYYVDVKEVRDTLVLDEQNNVKVEKEGGEGYAELISRLESVLDDYALSDAEGNEIATGEKRIYAPNIVIVKDGEPLTKVDGTSSLQTDAYQELTDEMVTEMQEIFKAAFGLLNDKAACSVKGC